jgi:hypothetical protein
MQDRLAKEILTSRTLREAGLKAGYSIKARNIYRASTKKHILKKLEQVGVSKETMVEYFTALAKLALDEKDLANANRSGENLAKLYNLLKDNNIQQAVVNIQDTIAELKKPKPIDVMEVTNC